MDVKNSDNLYRIGTVATLTGISVERLRAWERRYDLAPAHKSGKTRFYNDAQLERLKLIKHLIDQGQPISTRADLDVDQLRARMEVAPTQPTRLSAAHRPRAGLVGPNLLTLEQQVNAASARLDVVARWANMEAFMQEQTAADNLQLLFLQLPVLAQQPIDMARDLYPEANLVVVYQFATEKTLTELQSSGQQTLKWPLSWTELEHVAIAEMGLAGRTDGAAPRRFSDEELIAIASESQHPSNCPQYLIEAINQLNAFSAYTRDCALAMPQAHLYQRVSAEASQARAHLEASLEGLLTELLPLSDELDEAGS
ncbi:MAG: MerR family transcriptional regulator [Pseudomonadota bacterium]